MPSFQAKKQQQMQMWLNAELKGPEASSVSGIPKGPKYCHSRDEDQNYLCFARSVACTLF